jgi:hypothetical protein
MAIIDRKYKDVIYFEELPKNIRHALEILVEWHSILVYEIRKGIYGFMVLDMYMPRFSNFDGIIESKYESIGHYIQIPIQKIIDTQFKGMRCGYFPKGVLELTSMRLSAAIVCDIHNGLGFSIEIHSNDYGFLKGGKSKTAPAYAHVLDEDDLEIGLLNISGPCPKLVGNIREFRPPYDFIDPKLIGKTPLMKHRRNIIKWANSNDDEGNQWERAQEMWDLEHQYKR